VFTILIHFNITFKLLKGCAVKDYFYVLRTVFFVCFVFLELGSISQTFNFKFLKTKVLRWGQNAMSVCTQMFG